jgi:hypothetical protein
MIEDKLTKGTYVGLKFSNETVDSIIKVAKSLNIPNVVTTNDIHCTLMYSRNYLEGYEAPREVSYETLIANFETFGQNKEILVIKLISQDLSNRHKFLMKEFNGTYDYDKYIPHVTLSYNIGDFDINSIDINDFNGIDFTVIKEYSEDLDKKYNDDK